MPAAAASSRSASAPADWKAASEESTECALPSTRVTWTSTSGRSPLDARSACARMPFSTLPWNWLGTVPPTIRCSKTIPEPGAPGLALDDDDGVLAVPAGLLDVPAGDARPAPASVSPSGTRTGTVVTATPCRVRSRSSSTSACAVAHAPQQQLAGVGAALEPHASGPRRPAGPAPSPAGPRRRGTRPRRATGSCGVGQVPRRHQQRVVRRGQRVAGLGAGQPGDRADVAGGAGRRPAAATCRAAR